MKGPMLYWLAVSIICLIVLLIGELTKPKVIIETKQEIPLGACEKIPSL